MKRRDQWTRKYKGWVEWKRRFLKGIVERIPEAAGQKVPAVAVVTVPGSHGPVPKR
jgi:hypothetical protein